MLKVLIAEDNLTVADLAEEISNRQSYQVHGTARTVVDAVIVGPPSFIAPSLPDSSRGLQIVAELVASGILLPSFYLGFQCPNSAATASRKSARPKPGNEYTRFAAMPVDFPKRCPEDSFRLIKIVQTFHCNSANLTMPRS